MVTTPELLPLAAAAAMFAACAATGGPGDEGCGDRLPGDLVVSELLVDPDGTDTEKEYIELYNATDADIDLAGVTLYLAAPDERKTTLRAGTIPPRGYFVLGDARSEPWPEHIDNAYGDRIGALSNDGGRIGIRCANRLIDEVSYGKIRPAHARELDGALVPDGTLNDLDTIWCDGALPIAGRSDFGTPGAPNMPCPTVAAAGRCVDAGTGLARDAAATAPGDLVINEIQPDPSAVPDSTGEWIELWARSPVDLNGLTLSTGGSTVQRITAEGCLHVGVGGHAILARSDDPIANGDLPFVTVRLTLSLPNDGGTLTLAAGSTPIDTFTWAKGKTGVAVQRDASDLALTCEATLPYGPTMTDRGTPGAANRACAYVGGGAAADSCTDLATGHSRDVVKPGAGALVVSEVMADPAAVADNVGEWFEVTAVEGVDLNGLELGNEGTGTTTVNAPECLPLAAGMPAIFARSTDPSENGGLPVVTAPFSFALANSGTAASPRGVVLRRDGVEIDRMTYTVTKAGIAGQVSEDRLDAAANDDSAAWCPTATTDPAGVPANQFGGGDHGTPAAPNGLCP